MRIYFIFLFLAAFVTHALGWDKLDHEIFDLVSAVEASEGKETTFYSWLDVPHTASTGQIAKAYRKLSMQLHPDKNPNDKKIHERFARLGVVSTILRNPEKRARYDFFYKNGVPKWRGTGYYYSRFRPGLGSVAVFLILVTSSLQYLVQRMSYKNDVARIERILADARLAAWGAKLTPIEGQRKVKVNLGGRSRYIDDDGNLVSGRVIEMVVEGQNVYILDPSGELDPLDTSAATPPAIRRTWFVALMLTLWNKVTSTSEKGLSKMGEVHESELEDDTSTDSGEGISSGTSTPRENGAPSAISGRAPVAKTGGKRRKVPRKR